uniref:Gustatory receptor n=1 Tax=Stomoxys calcitrans TaxID=35570 RepID=A0A1I8Q340_STOCA
MVNSQLSEKQTKMVTFKKLTKQVLGVVKIKNQPLKNDFNKISFLKFLKIYKNIFQLLGIIAYEGSKRPLFYGQRIWCILVLALIWAICTFEICSIPLALPTLEKGLYFCELFLYSLLCAVIYVNGFMKSLQFKNICGQFFKLHGQLHICSSKFIRLKGSGNALFKRLKREMAALTIGLLLFEIACIAANSVYRTFSGWWMLRSFAAYNLPNILINLNLCLYWLALRGIALLFTWANNILESLRQASKRQEQKQEHSDTLLWFQKEFNTHTYQKPSPSGKIHEIFLALSQANSDLSDLLSDIVAAFRIILVLNFLTSFLVLTIEFFELYKYFDNPTLNEIKLVTFKLIWLILHGGRIFFVLIANNAITTQKCRTLYILHGLPLEIFDSENNITQFILQLMVRKHTETACGMVDLDLMFLLGIINALAMYIIFLIQIDLGNVSMSNTNATVT